MSNINKNTWQAGSSLTDYYWQRSRDAGRAVEEMLKHPYSSQQMTDQTNRKYRMRALEAQGIHGEKLATLLNKEFPNIIPVSFKEPFQQK